MRGLVFTKIRNSYQAKFYVDYTINDQYTNIHIRIGKWDEGESYATLGTSNISTIQGNFQIATQELKLSDAVYKIFLYEKCKKGV